MELARAKILSFIVVCNYRGMADETYEFPLTLRVPRTAFVVVAPEPATVTQRTAEQHFGIPPRLYKELVRNGQFPTKRIGRLVFAAYDDVKRAVTEGASTHARVPRAAVSTEKKPDADAPMSIEEAASYLDSAQTPKERRERKKEIGDRAWQLFSKYDAKLDNGAPNPNYNKAMVNCGTGLILAASGLRPKSSLGTATTAAQRGEGHYGKCCWCDRPAYATKQTWEAEEGYWCGGPVCEVCARKRAANERVVCIEERQVLLPARDPSVPTQWYAPRRRRRPR